MIKIPFLLIPPKAFEQHPKLIKSVGIFRKIIPTLQFDLKALYYEISAEAYILATFLSFVIYFVLFSFLLYAILFVALPVDKHESIPSQSVSIGFLFSLLFLILLIAYPSILVKKINTKKNKNVLFALREIILSVNSGITLFDAMKNVSVSKDYGFVASDFERVIHSIESGKSEKEALREFAVFNQNDYLKRAAWQIINSIETGSRVGITLNIVTDSLEKEIYRDIRLYSTNLNFIMLIYLLGAAAVPSIGIAFLVLLSAFAGIGVDLTTIGVLLVGTSLFQIVLIGYISNARPDLFGG